MENSGAPNIFGPKVVNDDDFHPMGSKRVIDHSLTGIILQVVLQQQRFKTTDPFRSPSLSQVRSFW